MAQKTRNTTKTYFETGKIPSQEQYIDLIDSHLSIKDHNSGSIILSGSLETTGSNNILGQIKLGSDTSTNASIINKELTFDVEHSALSQTIQGQTTLNSAPDKDIIIASSGSSKIFVSS